MMLKLRYFLFLMFVLAFYREDILQKSDEWRSRTHRTNPNKTYLGFGIWKYKGKITYEFIIKSWAKMPFKNQEWTGLILILRDSYPES